MTFLQPLMLFGIPLIALPVVIHLINQRRYRTIRWGAMQFLLKANRMSRGYARVRQWLILAARTLAIAGLVFALGRPLSTGWLSLAAGGKPDTTIIIFDRSPSMLQQGRSGGKSKLETARDQLARSLGLIGSQHWLLVENGSAAPIEMESPESLNDLVPAEGVSASSDLPAMLQTALDYIRENRVGRCEIWICSDIRQHDWDAESGRWASIRDTFLEFPQPVRIHLLAYPDPAPLNRLIRVTDVRRAQNASGAELLVSLRVEQSTPAEATITIPVQLEVDGARSEVNLELSGSEVELKNHSIPLDESQVTGWGRAVIPADSNPSDNEFFFVYDRPVPRKTLIVAEQLEEVRPLQLAAAISPESGIDATIETITPDQLDTVDMAPLSLVLWQAPLPEEEHVRPLESFLQRGGEILFFPPESLTGREFAGLRWDGWRDLSDETTVAGWTTDQDLLAHTRSGASLPVGQLTISRYCQLAGEATPLATLTGGEPLLARALTDRRNVYFCTTSPVPTSSSLAQDGVVLYVMVQRALTAGATSLGSARQFIAGRVTAAATNDWRQLAGNPQVVSTSYAEQAGVYQHGSQLLAINRSDAEDRPAIVAETRIASLFDRLPFDRVDEQAGQANALLSEVWRLFLMLMMVSLIAEACLCLPRLGSTKKATTSSNVFTSPQGAPA